MLLISAQFTLSEQTCCSLKFDVFVWQNSIESLSICRIWYQIADSLKNHISFYFLEKLYLTHLICNFFLFFSASLLLFFLVSSPY